MLRLDWIHRDDGYWCHLERVDLDSVDTGGVYMIWHGGEEPKVVRVGQGGDIAQRLHHLKEAPEILAYKDNGELYVTWAAVPASKRDGVVCYLTENWNSLIGKPCPLIFPITVNSPFD
jgi:hypothetical protein